MSQSPLNYTGGKFKLLPQILPFFPRNINKFVDLFCGGGDVGTNVDSRVVHFNDLNQNVVGILRAFRTLDKEDTFQIINKLIEKYGLSDVGSNGYAHYNCESCSGLANYNRKPFLLLREHFNNLRKKDFTYYIELYVLVIYSFNNQIRFNKQGKFNLPVGKRDFNTKMQSKLSDYIDRLKEIDCVFSTDDFRNFDIESLDENDFVYVDPPYLITCATYNEQGGWNESLEKKLCDFLDTLHANNIRFALSNVLTSKGKTNIILRDWLSANPHYVCNHLNYQYSNSNYHTKDRTTGSDEVLIINY